MRQQSRSQRNRVEIVGFIEDIKAKSCYGSSLASLRVRTDFSYASEDCASIIESAYHEVFCWDGPRIVPLESIRKGDKVMITGRLRYTQIEGGVSALIIAESVQRLDPGEVLTIEE